MRVIIGDEQTPTDQSGNKSSGGVKSLVTNRVAQSYPVTMLPSTMVTIF